MEEDMYYDWDNSKNRKNQNRHGVSFEEASTVFEDEERIFTIDRKHSTEKETRFFTIGFSVEKRQLFVCYCERTTEDGIEIIRIISARKAGKKDRKRYLGGI